MAQLIDLAAARRHHVAQVLDGERLPAASGTGSEPSPRVAAAKRAAAATATLAWRERAEFFDRLVGAGLARMEEELGRRDLAAAGARRFLRGAVAELRASLTDILDRLERVAPLVPDGDAMRVYRVSDDPRRITQAQRYWGSAEAERLGMVPGSHLMVLRNVVIRLERSPEAGGPSRPGRSAP